MTPKATTNPKLGDIFAKCAPMTPSGATPGSDCRRCGQKFNLEVFLELVWLLRSEFKQKGKMYTQAHYYHKSHFNS